MPHIKKRLPITILFHPRKAIADLLVRDLNHGLGLLCFFFGLGLTFSVLKTLFAWDFIITLWVSIGLGFFAGYGLFSFLAFLFHRLGKMVKAGGSYKEIRALVAWSHIPLIFFFLISIFLAISHEGDFWSSTLDSQPFLWSAFFVKLFMISWTFFLLIETLVEVMKLSFTKALGLFVLVFFIYVAALFFFLWILGTVLT